MKVASLFSGGKDSTFAVWKSVSRGDEIVSLLTLEPENPDSYMFHHPNVLWTKLQAESMGIPLKMLKTKGVKEEELKDLELGLSEIPGIECITAGALASEYQKSRVEKIASKLGLKVYSPAWHIDPEDYWRQLLEADFRIMITKIASEGLGKEWLGKIIDKENFQELKKLSKKYRFHLAFEGGEAETFVLDCPLFSRKIEVTESKTHWDGETGHVSIQKALLKKKVKNSS